MKKQDLSGQRFGSWTVIGPHSASRNGATRWLCQCDCGVQKDVYASHLVSGKSKSCGCQRPRAAERKQWTGYGGISGRFWHQIKRGADGSKGRRKIEFSITIEDAWNLYVEQGGRCALSKLALSLGERYGDAITASLDRIDSDLGYVPGNVQWLHKDVNRMKGNLDEKRFVHLCACIAGDWESRRDNEWLPPVEAMRYSSGNVGPVRDII